MNEIKPRWENLDAETQNYDNGAGWIFGRVLANRGVGFTPLCRKSTESTTSSDEIPKRHGEITNVELNLP